MDTHRALQAKAEFLVTEHNIGYRSIGHAERAKEEREEIARELDFYGYLEAARYLRGL